MSELSTISKVFFVLGFLAVLAVMIYGASGPILIPNPTAPTFSNPFDVRGYTQKAILNQQYHYQEISTVSNQTDRVCSRIKFYDCLIDLNGPDYNSTRLSLFPANITQYNFTTGFFPDSQALVGVIAQGADWTRFTGFSARVWCRWVVPPSNANTSLTLVFTQVLDPRNTVVFGADSQNQCPVGNWGEVSFLDSSFTGTPNDANANIELDLDTGFGPNDGQLDISTVYLQVFFSGNQQCNGNGFFGDLSCQFTNFFNFVSDLGHWGINVLLFIGGWLLFGVVFITNFIVIISWLYAIPNAPVSVQLFISSVFTAMFGMIIISIVKMVRGGSP